MGAQSMIESFHCKRSELAGMVEAEVSRDGYDNGHSYGGGWASKSNTFLTIHPKIFVDHGEAEDFILEHNDKWEGLDAVRVINGLDARGYAALGKKVARVGKLRELLTVDLPTSAVLRAKSGKSKTRTCSACGTRHVLCDIKPWTSDYDSDFNRVNEKYHGQCQNLKCRRPFLFTKADLAKAQRYESQIAELTEDILQIAKNLPEDAPCFVWVVGGWCPS